MTKVLIADDQGIVRDGLRMILEAQEDIEVVGEAADGLDALQLARELEPDIVLMDIRMPKLDGIAATRRLLAKSPPARVLVLTTSARTTTCMRPCVPARAAFCSRTPSVATCSTPCGWSPRATNSSIHRSRGV